MLVRDYPAGQHAIIVFSESTYHLSRLRRAAAGDKQEKPNEIGHVSGSHKTELW